MSIDQDYEIKFRHLVHLPHCAALFCSTYNTRINRTRLYLVFDNSNRVYVRNGVRQVWDEVKDREEFEKVNEGLRIVLHQRNVPCFNV